MKTGSAARIDRTGIASGNDGDRLRSGPRDYTAVVGGTEAIAENPALVVSVELERPRIGRGMPNVLNLLGVGHNPAPGQHWHLSEEKIAFQL
jgi:hypothetical protein